MTQSPYQRNDDSWIFYLLLGIGAGLYLGYCYWPDVIEAFK